MQEEEIIDKSINPTQAQVDQTSLDDVAIGEDNFFCRNRAQET